MGQRNRIRRGMAGWQKVIARQTRSGLSVPVYCRREGINASLFRRWQSRLTDSEADSRSTPPTVRGLTCAAPFIDLGELRAGTPRLEVRLDLGAGVVLSIARG